MERSAQISCSRRLLDHIENRQTDMADAAYRHPVSDYTSVNQLADEKAKLFRSYPIFLGFSSDLPNTGDYL